MKARLKNPLDVEAGKIFNIRLDTKYGPEAIRVYEVPGSHLSSHPSFENFLEFWEVLQGVSDTTQQQIREAIVSEWQSELNGFKPAQREWNDIYNDRRFTEDDPDISTPEGFREFQEVYWTKDSREYFNGVIDDMVARVVGVLSGSIESSKE